MNENSTPAPAALLSLARSFYRDPLSFQDLRQGRSSLPAGVEAILLAAGASQDQPGSAGEDAEELRKAAVFFIEQVLFAPNADYYRLLGLSPQEATDAKIKEHYHLLMRLFHPDRRVSQDDWQAAYAGRLTQAYNVLRRPQSRSEYNALRSAALDITAPPWRPPSRPAKRPPVRSAATPWRRHLPQYVLTGVALAASLFVLQVYLSQGLRASRTVSPPGPATSAPATAERAAPEPPAVDHPHPLLNELAQALQRGVAETGPSSPPPAPVTEALTGSAASPPASGQASPAGPAADGSAVAAVVKAGALPADHQSPPPPPVNTDPAGSPKPEAALAERRDSQPTPVADAALPAAPASREETPPRPPPAPAVTENPAPGQNAEDVKAHQPPSPAPVSQENPAATARETVPAADHTSSPLREQPKTSAEPTIGVPGAPVLNAKPADPLALPRSRPEEQGAEPAARLAPLANTVALPQASPSPPSPAPVARPAQSARPNPPPISPAESSSLLRRFVAAYNQGDLGTMRALFGPGNPALNQYRDLFSRTAARQLVVTNFQWRFTPGGALGRGGLSMRLRHHGPIPDQSYSGCLELELERQEGGRLYIRRVNHLLRQGPAPATPRTPEAGYGGNG